MKYPPMLGCRLLAYNLAEGLEDTHDAEDNFEAESLGLRRDCKSICGQSVDGNDIIWCDFG